MPERVFVYGSLRRGWGHAHLLRKAHFLGPHITAAGYTLYDLGEYPAAVADGHGTLTGEVFAVDAETFKLMDELEEYPAVYTRQLIATPWGDAWIYLMPAPPPGAPVIENGDWAEKA